MSAGVLVKDAIKKESIWDILCVSVVDLEAVVDKQTNQIHSLSVKLIGNRPEEPVNNAPIIPKQNGLIEDLYVRIRTLTKRIEVNTNLIDELF